MAGMFEMIFILPFPFERVKAEGMHTSGYNQSIYRVKQRFWSSRLLCLVMEERHHVMCSLLA